MIKPGDNFKQSRKAPYQIRGAREKRSLLSMSFKEKIITYLIHSLSEASIERRCSRLASYINLGSVIEGRSLTLEHSQPHSEKNLCLLRYPSRMGAIPTERNQIDVLLISICNATRLLSPEVRSTLQLSEKTHQGVRPLIAIN